MSITHVIEDANTLTRAPRNDAPEISPLEAMERALHRAAAEAVRLDVLDSKLRQVCLRALNASGRTNRIRPRTMDERIAKLRRAVAKVMRVLPVGWDATAPMSDNPGPTRTTTVGPPRSRAPRAIAPRERDRIPVRVLRETLGLLDALRQPMHPAVAAGLFASAVSPQPFRARTAEDVPVLACEGTEGDLRAFVPGRVRAGSAPREILATWCGDARGSATTALRRKIERLVTQVRRGQSLVDGRAHRAQVMWSCPPLVQAIILKVAFARPGATRTAIAKAVAQELPVWLSRARAVGVAADVRAPSNQTVTRFMERWSDLATESQEEGVTAALKSNRPVDRYSKATKPNQVWQLDHVTLDMAAREIVGETDRVVRPTLSALIDEASGLCVAWVIDSEAATAFSTSRVLYRALTPWREGGRTKTCCPMTLRHDRGRDFLSRHVARLLAKLGVEQDVCPPRTPNARPEQERFFKSLHDGCSALPSFIGKGGLLFADAASKPDSLPTMTQLIQHLEDWTLEFNTSVHRGATMSPVQAWSQSLGPMVPADLAWRLLRSDVRRVIQREGIEFQGRFYSGPLAHPDGRTLTELHRVPVRIYSTPDFIDQIWVTVWESDGSGREEAYLGSASISQPGEPSLDMQEVFGDARDDMRQLARTAQSLSASEDRDRQAKAISSAHAPVLDLLEHRRAANATEQSKRRAASREQTRHTALLRAPALIFTTPDDQNSSGMSPTPHDAWSPQESAR